MVVGRLCENRSIRSRRRGSPNVVFFFESGTFTHKYLRCRAREIGDGDSFYRTVSKTCARVHSVLFIYVYMVEMYAYTLYNRYFFSFFLSRCRYKRYATII